MWGEIVPLLLGELPSREGFDFKDKDADNLAAKIKLGYSACELSPDNLDKQPHFSFGQGQGHFADVRVGHLGHEMVLGTHRV